MAIRSVAVVCVLALASGDSVVTLTGKSFDHHLRDTPQTLVEFHAPWCGHCKKLAPEFEQAASKLTGSKVKLAMVDATEEKDLASRFNVRGFPTLLWFDGGKEMEYDGGRTADTIVEWVNSMLGDAIIETSAPADPSSERPRIVLYSSSMLAGFEAAAKSNRRKAVWYHVKSSDKHRVVITHRGEEDTELTGVLDESRITEFLSDNALPLFGQLDGDSFDKYMEAGKGLVWSMFPNEAMSVQELDKEYRPMMSEVARKFKGKYFVTYTDTDKFKEAISNMLGVDSFPAIAVQKKAGDKKRYVHTRAMTASAISEFIADVEAGRVQPTMKSEEVPVGNVDQVKVIVGKTMERELFSPDKDVMLEVYAPWCGHCKKLEPEYVRLAKKIEAEKLTDLLTIAKMDGAANDSPLDSVEWSGFPAIFFAKAGSREVLTYEGERTAKGLWKFIKKHATKAEEIKERMAKAKNKQGEL